MTLHHPIRLFFILYFVFCIFLACEKATAPVMPTGTAIRLTAEEVLVTEAWLHLQVEVPPDSALQVKIYRNDRLRWQFALTGRDTTLWERALAPAQSYRYRAELRAGEQLLGSSPTLEITTLDTTTHQFTWFRDTIGIFPSRLHDVFAISDEDVWAVGEIHTPETDRYDSLGNWIRPYNAMHWNGQEWEYMRINFYLCPNGTLPHSFPIQAVYALSENDIWFTRGGSIVHWDGSNFIHDCSINSVIDGSIYQIWGTDKNNLYGVGAYGTIVHYDGTGWQRMESGTTLPLTDIWGFAEDDIYVVGASLSSADNIVLHYDGQQWQPLPGDSNRKVGVWGTSSRFLCFCGDGVRRYVNGTFQLIDWPAGFPPIFTHAIRGSGANNIFAVGGFNTILHFNGMTWKGYSELFNWSGAGLDAVSVTPNSVFIVGSNTMGAYIFRGMRQN